MSGYKHAEEDSIVTVSTQLVTLHDGKNWFYKMVIWGKKGISIHTVTHIITTPKVCGPLRQLVRCNSQTLMGPPT